MNSNNNYVSYYSHSDLVDVTNHMQKAYERKVNSMETDDYGFLNSSYNYDNSNDIPYDELAKRAQYSREYYMKRAKFYDMNKLVQESRQNIDGSLVLDESGAIIDKRQFANGYLGGYDVNNPGRIQGGPVYVSSRVLYGDTFDRDAKEYNNLKIVRIPADQPPNIM